ncbi:uncharacterized protein B0P05DRAFT_532269 [Gilbertella persicaria]|uniref:uncharacterized protein n=1 Tax=Gilbertella persicaria TaxID=101096 RepID=UPI00221EDEC9|nr:uncharacterized protein B0P05DRAFT_532269 [Gilbertella persicaria]KAI8087778.1 hypothetical protein B0P05DRAFT_532269 [Gilbertella persicaria]
MTSFVSPIIQSFLLACVIPFHGSVYVIDQLRTFCIQCFESYIFFSFLSMEVYDMEQSLSQSL